MIKNCNICGIAKKGTFRRCFKCRKYVCHFCIEEVEIFSFNPSDMNLLGEEYIYYEYDRGSRDSINEGRQNQMQTARITKRICLRCLEEYNF
jgi:hypothetical protein